MAALAALPVLAALPAAAPAQEAEHPYAGLEAREIKALSTEEIAELRAGEGMGLALAAELNHYPGPRHVLALADSLGLSARQRADVEAVGDAMRARAVALGDSIVAAEAALDCAFAHGSIEEAELERHVAGIARLQGALRTVHLAAHLATRRLLSPEQVARYDALRGYAGGEPGEHAH